MWFGRRRGRRRLSKQAWIKARARDREMERIYSYRRMITAEDIYDLPTVNDERLRKRRYEQIATCRNTEKSQLIEKFKGAKTVAELRRLCYAPKTKNGLTNIYVIGSSIHKPFKIGKADDVQKRLKGLQTASP